MRNVTNYDLLQQSKRKGFIIIRFFFSIEFMKRLSLSFFMLFVSVNALSEISDDWLDDDILFNESDAQLELDAELTQGNKEVEEQSLESNITELSENNSIQDENKPISLDSWFMPFLKKKKFSFFSLELDENYKNEFKKQMILLKDYLKK